MADNQTAAHPQDTHLDRLRARFDEQKIDMLLVTEPHNRRYLSRFTDPPGR